MSDVDAVNAVSDAEERAIFSSDPDAMAELFTEDCVLMPPNQPQSVGHEGVRDWLMGVVAAFDISGGYTRTEVTISGETAVQRYYAEMQMTPKDGGDTVAVPVKGLHIMRRQADGSWKISQDIWNTDTE